MQSSKTRRINTIELKQGGELDASQANEVKETDTPQREDAAGDEDGEEGDGLKHKNKKMKAMNSQTKEYLKTLRTKKRIDKVVGYSRERKKELEKTYAFTHIPGFSVHLPGREPERVQLASTKTDKVENAEKRLDHAKFLDESGLNKAVIEEKTEDVVEQIEKTPKHLTSAQSVTKVLSNTLAKDGISSGTKTGNSTDSYRYDTQPYQKPYYSSSTVLSGVSLENEIFQPDEDKIKEVSQHQEVVQFLIRAKHDLNELEKKPPIRRALQLARNVVYISKFVSTQIENIPIKNATADIDMKHLDAQKAAIEAAINRVKTAKYVNSQIMSQSTRNIHEMYLDYQAKANKFTKALKTGQVAELITIKNIVADIYELLAKFGRPSDALKSFYKSVVDAGTKQQNAINKTLRPHGPPNLPQNERNEYNEDDDDNNEDNDDDEMFHEADDKNHDPDNDFSGLDAGPPMTRREYYEKFSWRMPEWYRKNLLIDIEHEEAIDREKDGTHAIDAGVQEDQEGGGLIYPPKIKIQIRPHISKTLPTFQATEEERATLFSDLKIASDNFKGILIKFDPKNALQEIDGVVNKLKAGLTSTLDAVHDVNAKLSDDITNDPLFPSQQQSSENYIEVNRGTSSVHSGLWHAPQTMAKNVNFESKFSTALRNQNLTPQQISFLKIVDELSKERDIEHAKTGDAANRAPISGIKLRDDKTALVSPNKPSTIPENLGALFQKPPTASTVDESDDAVGINPQTGVGDYDVTLGNTADAANNIDQNSGTLVSVEAANILQHPPPPPPVLQPTAPPITEAAPTDTSASSKADTEPADVLPAEALAQPTPPQQPNASVATANAAQNVQSAAAPVKNVEEGHYDYDDIGSWPTIQTDFRHFYELHAQDIEENREKLAEYVFSDMNPRLANLTFTDRDLNYGNINLLMIGLAVLQSLGLNFLSISKAACRNVANAVFNVRNQNSTQHGVASVVMNIPNVLSPKWVEAFLPQGAVLTIGINKTSLKVPNKVLMYGIYNQFKDGSLQNGPNKYKTFGEQTGHTTSEQRGWGIDDGETTIDNNPPVRYNANTPLKLHIYHLAERDRDAAVYALNSNKHMFDPKEFRKIYTDLYSGRFYN